MKLSERWKKLTAYVAVLVLAVPAILYADYKLEGSTGAVAEVEYNTLALRVTSLPRNIGSLGAYSMAGTTGTIAAGMAANSAIFTYRWTSGTAVAILDQVLVGAASGATGFAAGQASCGLVFARSYTVTGTTGSVSIATTGSEGKRRTSFGTTLVANGDLRISGTAASTGQTWSLDVADQTRLGPFGVTATAQTAFIPAGTVLYARNDNTEWPIIFTQNEGFAVRCTVPATGVWVATVTARWTELAAFP